MDGTGSKIMTETLIVVILDESSSMGSRVDHVLTGFNQFIQQQILVATDRARLTLIKFNRRVTVAYSGVNMNDVPELTRHNYRLQGGTALFDAIAQGVRLADGLKADGERVVCVIMTDGAEYSSRETTGQQVRHMIGEREARGDWTFVYIGEQPHRWSQYYGVSASNTSPYNSVNSPEMMSELSAGMRLFRSSDSSHSSDFFSPGSPEPGL